ncbi:MAG TPA: MarR family transcriptional regulator [Nocardioidaceae bacterium]|nr:MarR family transcriptional regulator [Nocardioidaceae bacterium]
MRTEPATATLTGFEAAWDDFFAAIRRARGRAAAREREGELTLSQHNLLTALHHQPSLPVGEVALAAGVAPPTATRMLGQLERAGVVRREASVTDRRVVTVSLTPRGRELLAKKRATVSAKRRDFFESLTDAERAHSEGLLRGMAELIEQL